MAKQGLFEGAGPLHCVDDGVKIKLCTCALVFDGRLWWMQYH